MKNGMNDISILKTNQIDEIIGRPPIWLVRWGSMLLCLILLFVALMGYYISVPQIISVPFKIFANHNILKIYNVQKSELVEVIDHKNALYYKGEPIFTISYCDQNKKKILFTYKAPFRCYVQLNKIHASISFMPHQLICMVSSADSLEAILRLPKNNFFKIGTSKVVKLHFETDNRKNYEIKKPAFVFMKSGINDSVNIVSIPISNEIMNPESLIRSGSEGMAYISINDQRLGAIIFNSKFR